MATLIAAQLSDIAHLQNWFADEQALFQWGGPGLTLTADIATFAKQIKLKELASYGLFEDSELIGFGQFYLRLNRCHLGRLVIAPKARRQGKGKILIKQLIQQGTTQLACQGCSLFVLADNFAAKNLYQALGFSVAPYPTDIGIANCLYMTKG